MILMLIHNTLEWAKDIASWGINTVKNTIAKFAIISFVFIVLLWLSVFMYGSFYYVYMPPVSLIKPLSFGFSVCDDGLQMCSYPTANITLLREGYSEVFVRGEAYSIKMDIELPESQANKDLGMFMTKLTLYDRIGETVACSTKSAMLQYRSELLRVIDTFVFSPLFLSGFAQQKQSLMIEFYTDYKDDAYNPAIGAVIEIQSLKIQIYSSLLRIHAHFSGLRYLLFHWPVLSALVGVTMNLMFLSFIAFLSWYNFLWGNGKKENQNPHLTRGNRRNQYDERRRNVKAMLKKEREEQALEEENYSRLAYSSSGEVSSSDQRHSETSSGPKYADYVEDIKPDNGEGEESFILAKDQTDSDCETELRHRKFQHSS